MVAVAMASISKKQFTGRSVDQGSMDILTVIARIVQPREREGEQVVTGRG